MINKLLSLISSSFNSLSCSSFHFLSLRSQCQSFFGKVLVTALSLFWLSGNVLAEGDNTLLNGDSFIDDVAQDQLTVSDDVTESTDDVDLTLTSYELISDNDVVPAECPATASDDFTASKTESDFTSYELTGNNQAVAEALDGACSALMSDEGHLSEENQQLLDRCEGLTALDLPESDLNAVYRAIAPEETAAQLRAASENSRHQTQAVYQRLNLLKQGVNQFSVNGISLFDSGATGGSAGDETSSFSRLGLFASVHSTGADRDETDRESGYDQSGQIFTFGADYAVSSQIFVGAAIGITESDLDYSKNGGDLETDITTMIIYATYYREQISADLQVGFGSIDYDSKRRIQYVDGNGPVDALAVASTEGSQFILNGQVQYDWYRDALTLYPFLRFDYVESDIDSYGENSGQGLEIEFEDQEFSRLTLSAGVQGSYAISQEWGVLIPTFQASLLSEASVDNDDIVGRFAFDLEDDNKFNLVQDDRDSVFYQLGVGVVATLPRGLSLFAEYMQTLGYANLDGYQLSTGISYEF